MRLSIIIVNYHTDKLVQACVASIARQKVDFEYEIIVEDNSQRNLGFGAANNLGARRASGQYLLFLNPDTVLIEPDSLQKLVNYADQNPQAAVIAPRLIDRDGRYQWSADYQVSLAQMLLDKPLALTYRHLGHVGSATRMLAFFSLRYEFGKTLTDIDRVSGAALMIRKQAFEEVNGFDERFFLYFEDDDLCQRIKEAGYEVHYYPEVTIQHLVGQSLARDSNAREKYYYQSQEHYFAKHLPRWEYWLLKLLRVPYRALGLRRWLNRYY